MKKLIVFIMIFLAFLAHGEYDDNVISKIYFGIPGEHNKNFAEISYDVAIKETNMLAGLMLW